VGGHYPVWSGCSHGPDATLQAKLKPLLEKYHASGYMRALGLPPTPTPTPV
jgi:acid phosphatase/tartrate-resistant acid phosphatase type 5